MSTVLRKNEHRSLDGIYCDRCGLAVVKWEVARCMPSNVVVLVREPVPMWPEPFGSVKP